MAKKGIDIVVKGKTHFLKGNIDEYTNFSPLELADEPLLLNMRDIVRLNSMGVRGLLEFLRKWGDREYRFSECPVDFVSQISLIPALLQLGKKRTGHVDSLQVPFSCDHCDTEVEVLYETKHLPSKPHTIQHPCPKCAKSMRLSFEGYLEFAKKES